MSRMTDERRHELFETLLHLVAEHGYERVTMDQVADTAHASKATLYRQWSSKETFFVDALVSGLDEAMPLIDTGSLRTDLYALLDRQVEAIRRGGDLVPAILHVVKSDPAIGTAFREEVVARNIVEVTDLVDRAVARNELAPDHLPVSHLAILLATPLVLFQPFHGREPDIEDLRSFTDAVVLPALGLSATS